VDRVLLNARASVKCQLNGTLVLYESSGTIALRGLVTCCSSHPGGRRTICARYQSPIRDGFASQSAKIARNSRSPARRRDQLERLVRYLVRPPLPAGSTGA
jgi:hypothetical protein